MLSDTSILSSAVIPACAGMTEIPNSFLSQSNRVAEFTLFEPPECVFWGFLPSLTPRFVVLAGTAWSDVNSIFDCKVHICKELEHSETIGGDLARHLL